MDVCNLSIYLSTWLLSLATTTCMFLLLTQVIEESGRKKIRNLAGGRNAPAEEATGEVTVVRAVELLAPEGDE